MLAASFDLSAQAEVCDLSLKITVKQIEILQELFLLLIGHLGNFRIIWEMQQNIGQLKVSMYYTKSPKILTTFKDAWKYAGNLLLCQLFSQLDESIEVAAIAEVLNHVDAGLCLDRVV